MSNTINAEANFIVQQALNEATTSGGEIGVQVAAYLNGKLVIDAWSGYADQDSGRKVDGDTLFNVYSVTKAVAATALHILADRGFIDYNAPVIKYWPEYGAHGKYKTTVRDVLTHRACIPQMPDNVTPERMCDWDWMIRAVADLKPLSEPGTKTMYLSMTFGWIVGELVRRADPQRRSLGRFVLEEIAAPLNISDLWIGLPNQALPRLARHVDAMVPVPPEYLPPLFLASMPDQVALTPRVFDRPDVRRAEVAGVGGIFNARSEARFWAMLANGGELDGARLLSKELVATLAIPRAHSEEADPVMFGFPIPITMGGYWFGGEHPPVAAAKYARALCHPGQGNSFGWADPHTNLAVAICHNKLFNPTSNEENPLRPVTDAVRSALGL